MFKFFSKNKNPKKRMIALDIGTEFVKALLFEVVEDKELGGKRKGIIKGTGKVRQKLGEMYSGSVTNVEGVIYNCKEAIREAELEANMSANQLILGIAGEHIKGIMSEVRYKRGEPEAKINLAELKNIVYKIQGDSFKKARKKVSWETGEDEVDLKLINSVISDFKIDDYKISNPMGFQGKKVEVSIYNSFAPLVHFGALQTIAAELEKELLSIVTEPYAVSKCLDFEDGGNYSAIFIDIGGGTTDIAIVENGNIKSTKIFAMGGRNFTKRLSAELNVSFQEAEKIKLSYSAGNLEKKSHNIVKKIMEEDADVWLSGVSVSLSEIKEIEHLPSQIYLCGGGSHLIEIKELIQNKDFSKRLNFTKIPNVALLQPERIERVLDETGQIKDQQDITPMALANIGIDLSGEEAVMSKILRKALNLLRN